VYVGLADGTGVADVNPMVDFINAPLVVTVCCEDFLKFGNELIKVIDLFVVQVRPGAGHQVLEFFIKPSRPSRLLFLIVQKAAHVTGSPCDIVVP
jgi:hypothetical protein